MGIKTVCVTALYYLSVVKLSVHIDLSLCDVTSQVRNRMSDVWETQETTVTTTLQSLALWACGWANEYHHWAWWGWGSEWWSHYGLLLCLLSHRWWPNLCTCNQGNLAGPAPLLWLQTPETQVAQFISNFLHPFQNKCAESMADLPESLCVGAHISEDD